MIKTDRTNEETAQALDDLVKSDGWDILRDLIDTAHGPAAQIQYLDEAMRGLTVDGVDAQHSVVAQIPRREQGRVRRARPGRGQAPHGEAGEGQEDGVRQVRRAAPGAAPMTITPHTDRVLVVLPDSLAHQQTTSGLFLAAALTPPLTYGTVYKVGPQVKDVNPGDVVAFPPTAGDSYDLGTHACLFVREREIVAYIPKRHLPEAVSA